MSNTWIFFSVIYPIEIMGFGKRFWLDLLNKCFILSTKVTQNILPTNLKKLFSRPLPDYVPFWDYHRESLKWILVFNPKFGYNVWKSAKKNWLFRIRVDYWTPMGSKTWKTKFRTINFGQNSSVKKIFKIIIL